MTRTRSFIETVEDWIDLYLSASAVVAAVQENRTPRPDHLRRLGIDPQAYLSMGHG